MHALYLGGGHSTAPARSLLPTTVSATADAAPAVSDVNVRLRLQPRLDEVSPWRWGVWPRVKSPSVYVRVQVQGLLFAALAQKQTHVGARADLPPSLLTISQGHPSSRRGRHQSVSQVAAKQQATL